MYLCPCPKQFFHEVLNISPPCIQILSIYFVLSLEKRCLLLERYVDVVIPLLTKSVQYSIAIYQRWPANSPCPHPRPLLGQPSLYLANERMRSVYMYTPWSTIWPEQKRRQCLSFKMMFGLWLSLVSQCCPRCSPFNGSLFNYKCTAGLNYNSVYIIIRLIK